MPRTTVVAGTTITASWANANVRDQVITPFPSASARDSSWTSPIEGAYAHLTDTNRLTHYDGTAWAPATNNIVARQAITSNDAGHTSSFTSDFSLTSVPVLSTRLYRVTLKCGYEILGVPGRWLVNFHVGGTLTDRFHDIDHSASDAANGEITASILWEPASGSLNIDVRFAEVTGASTLTLVAAATDVRRFWVEDVGPR